MDVNQETANAILNGFYGYFEQRPELNSLFRGRNVTVVAPSIIQVIGEMKEYWPLTVRQVYYQLVAREMIANMLKEYKNVSNTLKELRLNNWVSWDAIEDRSRRTIEKRGVTNLELHLQEKSKFLFEFYQRCLVQNQGNYVEVWTEKDALTGIIENAVWIYCTRIVVAKGNSSTTYLNSYAERAKAAIKRGQTPVILYIGDLDPSGCKIPLTTVQKLKEDHGVDVELRRLALNQDQIQEYRLPHSVEPKKTDTNYPWFVKNYGDVAVEVDSLHPKVLSNLIVSGMESALDVEDMIEQQKIEKRERDTLKRLELSFRYTCRKEGICYWDKSY